MASSLKARLFRIFFPGSFMRRKYAAFRELLECDRRAQAHIAKLEESYYESPALDFNRVRRIYPQLAREMTAVIGRLQTMSVDSADRLARQLAVIDRRILPLLAPKDATSQPPFTILLEALTSEDVERAGGKAVNLARIRRSLGAPVPNGFVVTASACDAVYRFNRLRPRIDRLLGGVDIHNPSALKATSRQLTAMVRSARLPEDLEDALRQGFAAIPSRSGAPLKVAVRSSAIAEDSQLSFAGQYRTVLNVGQTEIIAAYKAVIASKYAPQALYYRIHNGLLDEETTMAVLVLEQVAAQASGVLYTRSPLNPSPGQMMLHSIHGLGAPLVSGAVRPDVFTILATPPEAPRIVATEVSPQDFKIVMPPAGRLEKMVLDANERVRPSLDRESALRLARWGLNLESHFGQPQDIEWCRDAAGQLYILQCRPLETYPPAPSPDECRLEDIPGQVLLSGGTKVSAGIGAGSVFKLTRQADLTRIPPNSVLVVHSTSPELAQVIDRLSAVVADIGSTAGHFASIAREFGVPMLANTNVATEVLQHGQTVTVFADGATVFAGYAAKLISGPCGAAKKIEKSPFFIRLKAVLEHISPLTLVDSRSPAFSPQNCSTLHDILRFAHEQAIRAMFALGADGARQLKGARRLATPIPLTLYVVDLDRGIRRKAADAAAIKLEDIQNAPFQSLWKGLSHPDIRWSAETQHFDWQAFDRMSGGLVRTDAPEVSSYALLSRDYLNLNFRFGYHFVVVDTLCGSQSAANYVFLSFKGGGGISDKRRLRALFLAEVLKHYEFSVDLKGDLVEAQLRRGSRAETETKLEMIGRLLGCTRLLDMFLEDEGMVRLLVAEFLKGRYRFGPFAGEPARPQP